MPSFTNLESDHTPRGAFGESWLAAVAAGSKILHGKSNEDLEKADVHLTWVGPLNGTYGPSVKVQVKTDINLAKNNNGDYVYALDADTYNFLSRDDHGVRRILVVIGLDISQPSVRLEDAGTLLVGGGAWVSLEGSPKTANTTSKTVVLPAKNTLDDQGLTRMLGEYGTRRSTPVDPFDPWGQS